MRRSMIPAQPPPSMILSRGLFGHLTPIRNGELFFEAWRRFIDREELKVGDAVLLTLGEQADGEDVRTDPRTS